MFVVVSLHASAISHCVAIVASFHVVVVPSLCTIGATSLHIAIIVM